jgi:ABC-type nitrate/sulfonate/bicarbonate transport system substrate-binding protein
MIARKTILISALFLAVITATWGGQPRGEEESRSAPLRLSLAIQAVAPSSLIALLEEKGFLRESGLEFSVEEYPSGFAALDAMSGGEAQMATAADFAFSGKLDEEPTLRVVGRKNDDA